MRVLRRRPRLNRGPLLVLVTGPPAAGKTTVARRLAERLSLPLIAKDTIKEALFDTLPPDGDPLEWSRRLGGATFEILYALAAESLAAGASVILEANFVRGRSEERLRGLGAARIVEVHCRAPLDVILDRYAARERHPGHADAQRLDEVRSAVESGRHDPLELDGATIFVDTTSDVDVGTLAKQVTDCY